MAKIPNIFELMGGNAPHGLDPRELRRFLAEAGPNNRWLQIGPYNSYLRRGIPRNVAHGHTLQKPLDLASVQRTDLPATEAAEEASAKRQPAKFRNPRGKFRELMALLEAEAKRAGRDSVYVENIHNEFLPEVLQSMGYKFDERGGIQRRLGNVPSMWKRTS